MKTSSAKAKGRKLQQHVRDVLLEAFPTLEPDDVKSTSMGAQGEDVQLSPAARKLMPIAVETKARNSIAACRFFEQAQEHARAVKGGKANAVVVMKENRKQPVVMIDLNFLVQLLQYRELYLEKMNGTTT